MKSGYFNYKKQGGYTITDPDIKGSYEYNLLGKNMLICLDQNGFSKIQAYPPEDLVLIRRENGEKYSKWLTFIVCDGKKYCNFFRPGGEKPIVSEIEFLPEKAVYRYGFDKFKTETTVFAALETTDAVCEVNITNTSEREIELDVFPQIFPFLNMPDMSAWDIPYWYLRTALSHDENKNLTFYSRLMNARGVAAKRRNACCVFGGEGEVTAEYYMDRYVGAGDFYNPDAIFGGALGYDLTCKSGYAEMGEYNSIAGFQPVHAARYKVKLKPGESAAFTQVFSLLAQNGGEISPPEEIENKKLLLEKSARDKELQRLEDFYADLFSLNSVNSGNEEFDNYVNAFLPLQMRWVIALDRGWATGMRGTRDAANDFMGAFIYGFANARETLLHLFDCQRSDGWFPRQTGKDKNGAHDLRNYVDGGVFVLEFLYEYLCYTKDYGLLYEETGYLDNSERESVIKHIIKTLDYYAAPENMGKDNLLKIREGDWFDGVNQAGLLGEGQSVTVSCQYCMAVKYVKEIFKNLNIKEDISRYALLAERVADAVRGRAYNSSGFFNGVKNDAGDWAFSDDDPDGKSRMFAVPNAFAVISGVATDKQAESVFENYSKMKTDTGYKLFSAPFEERLSGIGRVASGDVIKGLLGNYTVYNHGSQGFMARALLGKKKAEFAADVMLWLLPYDQTRHPEEKTENPPYAIVNCYQDVPPCRHRTGFSFLTGTVAMAVRIVYNYMFGIKPSLGGLEIDPCLTKNFAEAEVKYNYNGKTLYLKYSAGNRASVKIDGMEADTVKDVLSGSPVAFIKDENLKNGSKIFITVEEK